MGFEGVHGRRLVGVADGDQLVRVSPATTRHAHNFPELRELGANTVEGFRVQVQKGDAKYINFNVSLQTLLFLYILMFQISP